MPRRTRSKRPVRRVRVSAVEQEHVRRQLGARVRSIRKTRGYTTTTLAQALGISQAQVSRLENGVQGLRSAVLLRLAKVLKVSPVVFFIDKKEAGEILAAIPRTRIRGLELVAQG